MRTLLNQRRNVVVDVLPRLAKVNTKLLDCQTQQGSGTARRLGEYRVSLLIVSLNVLAEIGVRKRCTTPFWEEHALPKPHAYFFAVVAQAALEIRDHREIV